MTSSRDGAPDGPKTWRARWWELRAERREQIALFSSQHDAWACYQTVSWFDWVANPTVEHLLDDGWHDVAAEVAASGVGRVATGIEFREWHTAFTAARR